MAEQIESVSGCRWPITLIGRGVDVWLVICLPHFFRRAAGRLVFLPSYHGRRPFASPKNLYPQPQTPPSRVFLSHTALNFLEIHPVFPQKFALYGREIPRLSRIFGYEYRFLINWLLQGGGRPPPSPLRRAGVHNVLGCAVSKEGVRSCAAAGGLFYW